MKRLNNIFDKICTEDNFRKAYYNAIAGKSKYKEVIQMEKNPNKYITEYLEEVKNETYKTSEYHIFKLWSGNKWRTIYKLPMKDRIVQHAIMNYLEPWFRKQFIVDTYSSIKGRGINRGLHRLKRALKLNPNLQYCLKLDIKKFYPSIDKDILKQKLLHKIKDRKLLSLLFEIIDSCDKGVPIGNYTSLYFANFYLTSFDLWIKNRHILYYFRYCDDMIILSETKEYLFYLLNNIKALLTDLHLQLKDNYLVFPIESRGVDFLGYITRHDYIKIRKHTKKNFRGHAI